MRQRIKRCAVFGFIVWGLPYESEIGEAFLCGVGHQIKVNPVREPPKCYLFRNAEGRKRLSVHHHRKHEQDKADIEMPSH